jgi:Lon protease-like protein
MEASLEARSRSESDQFIPLFPLGIVLLPQMRLPLHIFEERYKLMISQCLDEEKPFGIVHQTGKGIRRVGCTARIVEVLRRYEDGRMDIVTRGEQRFYIEAVDESLAYLQSSVIYFDDEFEASSEEEEALRTRVLDLLVRLDRASGNTRDYSALKAMDLKGLSFAVPGSEGFTPDERQRFLEMTSARRRLEKGADALAGVIERIRINEEVKTIIGGNGDVKALLKKKGIHPD